MLISLSPIKPPSCGSGSENPPTRNRNRDHLIAAVFYNQMLCKLSNRRLVSARVCAWLFYGPLMIDVRSASGDFAIAEQRRAAIDKMRCALECHCKSAITSVECE
jgi:hypothetical protein